MRKFYLLIVLLFFVSYGFSKKQKDFMSVVSPKGTCIFQDNWENMAENYHFPKWFSDAKFGIFIHWGVYSVPAYSSEWYSRNMYLKGSKEYEHHIVTYGGHKDFGYKDFIPMFKAEKFDANEWVKLFKEAGARYIVPVAEHHDGFAMYDSEHNPWNAVKMGPKKDIIGLLKEAIEKEGLIFGLSSHRLENAWFFNGGMEFPSDVQDTTITLYGKRAANEDYSDEVCMDFLVHTHELVDKYQPQLIWFDWSVNRIPTYFNKFMAYYYNCALDWGKGVVVNTKHGYPTNVQVGDVERGKLDVMRKYPWQTDTSIGKHSWCYVDNEENKTPRQIVHDLVDIVSKNGNLLLNIGPRADGTITEEQKNILLSIGKWLKVNGEAIYGTRCWVRSGEGEVKGTTGSFSDNEAASYTCQDIRFTTNKNNLYAVTLNWGKQVLIKSLNKTVLGNAKILKVEMLGSNQEISWEVKEEGLLLFFPRNKPCEFAYSFKISLDKMIGEALSPEMVDIPFKHG
ncbi:MAG: alpha-L-fucosidase [Phocaeicola plebeius]|uniref:alpha-L-fucosidase n=1 Tax=Phocaeicola plebeius TaxID=310297 RepID=UPI00304C8CA0